MNASTFIRTVLFVAAAGTWACSGAGDEADGAARADDEAQSGAQLPEGHPAPAPEAGPAVMRISYGCAGEEEFEITFSDEMSRASIEVGGETHELTRQEGESALLLGDGNVVFRGEGMSAVVEQDGNPVYTDCTATGHSGGAPPGPGPE